MKKTFSEINNEINDFIRKDEKERNLWGKISWKTKRIALCSEYRELFQLRSNEIQKYINEILEIAKLTEVINKPKVQWFKEYMSEESYKFWGIYFGNDIVPNEAWDIFTKQYQYTYGNWDETTEEIIRRIVCTRNKDMNLFGFITLTNEYGFPIDLEKLPSLIKSKAIVTEETRMEIAKMVMNIVLEFSSEDMGKKLLFIYRWYKGINKNDSSAIQKRANEWAIVLKESRKNTILGKFYTWYYQPQELDISRRSISFFYQRYMVMWRVGQLSRNVFDEVDFPGKARIKDFLKYVQPLDHANYHIIISGDPNQWKNKKPKVYKFLEELI
jgi:hypothetical protein